MAARLQASLLRALSIIAVQHCPLPCEFMQSRTYLMILKGETEGFRLFLWHFFDWKQKEPWELFSLFAFAQYKIQTEWRMYIINYKWFLYSCEYKILSIKVGT